MISVSNLTKTFGDFKALDNLSLNVKKGSVYGLIGPNGAGKTTAIKHITGVYMQDSGEVLISGEHIFENIPLKSKLIYIPDDLYFFPAYTIKSMAKFYKDIYPTWNEERFEKLKAVFNMDINRRISRLSKGMQKQVAFWLGISTMPDVMILDEPVDGLDPVMRRRVWSLIMQDVADRDTTVLISSHNLRELEDVCDHVGVLHDGKVVIEKGIDEVKSDFHKIQVAFSGELPESIKTLDIRHITSHGSVNLMIVKGDREAAVKTLKDANPLLIDILPLTLEEIFIYELGGMGYDIHNVII